MPKQGDMGAKKKMNEVKRNEDLKIWFSLETMPFSDFVKVKDLFLRPQMETLYKEMKFSLDSGAYYVVAGEVGSGKSTALRYAESHLNPKEYHVIHLTGGSWSFPELLRQVASSFGYVTRTNQQTILLKTIYEGYDSVREDGKSPVIFIDEAHLFNSDVFSQLHLLSQVNSPKAKITPVVLCGQSAKLIDAICSPYNKAFASRIMNGVILKAMTMEESGRYIDHHIKNIAHSSVDVFDTEAKIVLYQSSSGLPRLINHLALRSMKKAMDEERHTVTSSDVRECNKKWWTEDNIR